MDIVQIVFDILPSSLFSEEFLQETGKANKNIEWIGRVVGDEFNESLIFSAKGKSGKYRWINKNITINGRKEKLKSVESVSIKLGMRGKVTIPGIVYLNGYCGWAEWVFEDADDASKDFDIGFR